MENNVYTFADRTLINVNLSDNNFKDINTIDSKYFVQRVYHIDKPGTLVIKKDDMFAEDATLNLNKDDLLFLVRDLSTYKNKWSCYYKAVAVNSKDLLEIFIKNLAIEQEEKEQAEKEEAKAEACIKCDNCKPCC